MIILNLLILVLLHAICGTAAPHVSLLDTQSFKDVLVRQLPIPIWMKEIYGEKQNDPRLYHQRLTVSTSQPDDMSP